MPILFLDNFRGFRKTYIPLNDVNFLVGENSTGKTSVLGLLKLLSSPYFWFENTFNIPEVNFGHFDDMVSIDATERNYFSIGFISTVEEDRHQTTKKIHAFLTTFSQRDGRPYPAFYAYAYGDSEYRIYRTAKQVQFKQNSVPLYSDIQQFVQDVYNGWVHESRSAKTGYTVLPKEIRQFSNRMPMQLIVSMLDILKKGKQIASEDLDMRIPIMISEVAWLAPIRSKPRRTYDEYKLDFSPEGEHTPYLVKRILERKAEAKNFRDFLERIGKDSGLFKSIEIKTYGRGTTSPFELDIILNQKALCISNVGYGVAQALPVIVEIFARPEHSWFAIQQPEVHLHPKAQAALGDIFFDLSIREGKKFLVETHSDYTIDRFRLNYKRKDLEKKPQAQILYFERTSDGNAIYQLPIQDNGELPLDQPEGYRDFFVKEDLALLGL